MAQISIGFLGPLGTYSHQACSSLFGESQTQHTLVPLPTIGTVFEHVADGTLDFGVIPFENTSVGPVAETVALLRDTTLSTRAFLPLPIGHTLMARTTFDPTANPTSIKEIYSHEQALSQCASYLTKRYPQAVLTEVNSTAEAARRVADRATNDSLAICSKACASVYGLHIVDTNIQDAGVGNTTWFCIISRSDVSLPDGVPIPRES